MTSDFEGFSIPDFIHYILFPILILQKEPVFPFLMLSAKQGNYWAHFYNVSGVTRKYLHVNRARSMYLSRSFILFPQALMLTTVR